MMPAPTHQRCLIAGGGVSRGMFPCGHFAILGLGRALFLHPRPEFGGKYNVQGVSCGPSAIWGKGSFDSLQATGLANEAGIQCGQLRCMLPK